MNIINEITQATADAASVMNPAVLPRLEKAK